MRGGEPRGVGWWRRRVQLAWRGRTFVLGRRPAQLAPDAAAVVKLTDKQVATGVEESACAVRRAGSPLARVLAAVGKVARALAVTHVIEELALVALGSHLGGHACELMQAISLVLARDGAWRRRRGSLLSSFSCSRDRDTGRWSRPV